MFLRIQNLPFRGTLSYATQNVMIVVGFNLWLTFVVSGSGWEGTTHDALVLQDALECDDGLCVPQGNRPHF